MPKLYPVSQRNLLCVSFFFFFFFENTDFRQFLYSVKNGTFSLNTIGLSEATTAAPSPSESGDITTAPLRLLKNKFHGTVLCLISLNDPSDRVYFWCACGLIMYKELSGSIGY